MYETMPRGELEEQLGESAQAGLTEQEAAARLERSRTGQAQIGAHARALLF